VPGSIYWKDKEGVYLGCNSFQAKIVGLDSPEDVIGKTDYDFPWRDMAEQLKETDQRIMKTRKSEELFERVVLPDGAPLIMLTNKSPLYDDQDKVIGIIGTSLDVTDLKKIEEQERIAREEAIVAQTKEKLAEEIRRAVMVLASSIAHDLRTPLFCLSANNHTLENCLPVLLDYYHLARNAGLDSSIKPTDKIIRGIERLADTPKKVEGFITGMNLFIDDSLKAIKCSTSEFLIEDDLVECTSYKGIDNALRSYPFKENEKKLIQLDRSYYFKFLGNPVLFMRIIFNLLSNALYQIHKKGRGDIFISSEEQESFNIIRFKDTGGGTSADIVDHIFEGYTTTKEKGTGIGLAFCKLTMKSFGGDITCHSVEGDYIEFILTFPKIAEESFGLEE
jgi:PAS domain S-box-containing protein